MTENRGCLSILLPFLRKPSPPVPEAPRSQQSKFSAQEALLSPAERSFYGVLTQALRVRYVVFAKVRLCDVLKAGDRQSLNKIMQKHVDFVLCTPDRVSPILAIELDDKSHTAAKRKERDEFVDTAFAGAGLPLVHVACKRTYDTKEVAAIVERAIGPIHPT
ncbi:MAG: DUF2726 domain-containing protein [Pirellulales bacterium]|nr:DUF2726 domain-containing protein [Pirellulales bacterium]